jgi:hypothetical protein
VAIYKRSCGLQLLLLDDVELRKRNTMNGAGMNGMGGGALDNNNTIAQLQQENQALTDKLMQFREKVQGVIVSKKQLVDELTSMVCMYRMMVWYMLYALKVQGVIASKNQLVDEFTSMVCIVLYVVK